MKTAIIAVLACALLLSGCLQVDHYTVRLDPLADGRYQVVVRYDNIASSAEDEEAFLDDFEDLIGMINSPQDHWSHMEGIRFTRARLWTEDSILYGELRAECSKDDLSDAFLKITDAAYILDLADEGDEEMARLTTNGRTMVQDGRVVIVWPREASRLEYSITVLEEQQAPERSLAALFALRYPQGLEISIEP